LREAVSQFEDFRRYHRRTDRKFSSDGFLYASAIGSIQAQALQLLGGVSEALELAEAALRQARESTHLFTVGLLLGPALGGLRRWRREPEIALLESEEALMLSEENGFRDWFRWSKFNHG
jgi:hypothetical protein